jgi:LAGLIDADG endonuclease
LIIRNNKTEVRLNFQIDQKKNELLILIKNFFGGNIKTNLEIDGFSYNSSSLGSAKKIIHYFDKYFLLSHKHVDYLK